MTKWVFTCMWWLNYYCRDRRWIPRHTRMLQTCSSKEQILKKTIKHRNGSTLSCLNICIAWTVRKVLHWPLLLGEAIGDEKGMSHSKQHTKHLAEVEVWDLSPEICSKTAASFITHIYSFHTFLGTNCHLGTVTFIYSCSQLQLQMTLSSQEEMSVKLCSLTSYLFPSWGTKANHTVFSTSEKCIATTYTHGTHTEAPSNVVCQVFTHFLEVWLVKIH